MGISKASVDRDLSCILRSITGLFRGFRVCFVGVESVVEFRAVKVLVLSFMANPQIQSPAFIWSITRTDRDSELLVSASAWI